MTLLGAFTNKIQVLNCHWATLPFPVEWDQGKDKVCHPNGFKLAYYDSVLKIWSRQVLHRPTFAHHVKLVIPTDSPFSRILPNAYASEGPSSYEVMSSQSSCPAGLNIHEYLAFQTLLSGKARRWLAIMTELGSANLNFSIESTTLLLNHISLECGPVDDDENPFRVTHTIFQHYWFGEKLLEQLSQRLEHLATNWREVHLMDTIINLLDRTAILTKEAGLSELSNTTQLL